MACYLGFSSTDISWEWSSYENPGNTPFSKRTKYISVLVTEEEYQVLAGGKVALIFRVGGSESELIIVLTSMRQNIIIKNITTTVTDIAKMSLLL